MCSAGHSGRRRGYGRRRDTFISGKAIYLIFPTPFFSCQRSQDYLFYFICYDIFMPRSYFCIFHKSGLRLYLYFSWSLDMIGRFCYANLLIIYIGPIYSRPLQFSLFLFFCSLLSVFLGQCFAYRNPARTLISISSEDSLHFYIAFHRVRFSLSILRSLCGIPYVVDWSHNKLDYVLWASIIMAITASSRL
jgi:hypothetical protein